MATILRALFGRVTAFHIQTDSPLSILDLGCGDWLLLRSDAVLELDLRITLETDDRALIHMSFQGLRHGPADVIAALGRGEVVDPATYYFRTVPRFETSAEKYAFLNRIITVSVGETRPDGAVHRIEEIL